ncbi:diacylglycerol/lipid kinase family protein [Rubinisphaera margarita]|uniref:diacylglycerol/lipid kinase family protein n=1 Tax=Rubinisphaera margarita TaxID=2909586 RepID=UPI001EE8A0BB|nr:diacylglycerol kinase family protein [Rubinisphaera margarita]MCG6157959.1 hypothetical protein [Rubinisphaera margarita]
MSNHPKQVVISKNPYSGSGLREPQLMRLTKRLSELGLEPCVFTDRDALKQELENETFRKETRCIVAAGGDGTVDDMINRYPGVPLAVLPMGTENLLAKYFDMPRHGGEVAEMIAEGHIEPMDVGMVNKHRFAVMASCGFDAEVIYQAHLARSGRITKLHYVRPIWKTIRTFPGYRLTVTSPDLPEPAECDMAVVSNISRYASNLPVNPNSRHDDGLLSVCLFASARPVDLISYSIQGFLTRSIRSTKIRRFLTTSLSIDADQPVRFQADGESIGHTACEVSILPASLSLVVPARWVEKSRNTGHSEVRAVPLQQLPPLPVGQPE